MTRRIKTRAPRQTFVSQLESNCSRTLQRNAMLSDVGLDMLDAFGSRKIIASFMFRKSVDSAIYCTRFVYDPTTPRVER